MAGFWDFLGGASDYLLDERQRRAADERDLNKTKALEALRRETSDYEYGRARGDSLKQVDARQSYLDTATKSYVMVNSEGKEIGRRPATSSELAAEDATALKLEDMRTDIAYKKKQMSLMGVGGGGGGSRRGGGGSLDSSESASEKSTNKLQALATTVIGNLRKYDLPQSFIASAESIIRAKINSGSADEKWLRNFESAYLSTPGVRNALSAASIGSAADDTIGQALKHK